MQEAIGYSPESTHDYPAEPTQVIAYADPPYPPPTQYAEYPAEPQLYAPTEQAPLAGEIHDGMMVRVKIGFVRSLEDELGQSILPPQFPRFPRTDVSGQPSYRGSSSTSTRRTTTAGPCARTKTWRAAWSRSAASSHGRRAL